MFFFSFYKLHSQRRAADVTSFGCVFLFFFFKKRECRPITVILSTEGTRYDKRETNRIAVYNRERFPTVRRDYCYADAPWTETCGPELLSGKGDLTIIVTRASDSSPRVTGVAKENFFFYL